MVCEQVEAAVCPEGGDPAGFGDVVGSGEAVHVQNCVSQAGHDLWGGAGVYGGAVLGEGHVADPMDNVLDAPVAAQPGGDHRRPGVFEREAADCVDDLPGAFAGRRGDAFAGDLDDLFGCAMSAERGPM